MRWADLDQLGHVNNVVYVDYLQEARVDLLRAHGRGPRALADGLVVVRHEVTYLKPLTYDFRPVSIECWVTDIKAATFTMAYEIFHDAPSSDGADGDRVVYLRATTVLTPFVFAEERPRRITAEEREALEGHLEPDAQPRRRTPSPARRGHQRLPDPRPVLRRRRLRARQQREVLRVPPGGADLDDQPSWCRSAGSASWWRRRTSTTSSRCCSGPSPTTAVRRSPGSARGR